MKKFVLTPLAAAVLSASAYAADEAPKTFTLDKVTVAATLTEQKLEDVANTVSVVNAEQIENQGSNNIRDALRYEPGIEISTQGRFGLNSVNIRGANENQVKIVVDGIDQVKVFNASADRFQASGRFSLDMDALKQVEVVKGPASSLYGSNAIGGVVAFTTKDPADYLNDSDSDTSVSLKTAYTGADEGKSATLTLANRTGQFESLVVYTERRGDELENQGSVDGIGEERTKTDPQDFESSNLLLKLQYQVSDTHRVGFTYENYDAELEEEVLSGLSSNYVSFNGEDTNERERFSLNHSWNAQLTLFDKVETSLSYQETKNHHVTNQLISAAPSSSYRYGFPFGTNAVEEGRVKDYSYEEEQWQLDGVFSKEVNNHQLTYGFNLKRTDATSIANTLFDNPAYDNDIARWVPLIEEETYGVFIQDHITLLDGKLTLTPSVRYDKYETKAKADSAFTTELPSQDESKVSFRLGSVYKFTDELSAFAQYAQGFKTPDLIDLYREYDGGRYLIDANPDLKPEESDSYEIGLRYNTDKGSLEIAAFYNDYDNYIDSVTISTAPPYTSGVTQHQNISEATIKGLEIRGSLWLDDALGAPTGTSLQFAAAYAKGEGKDDGGSDEPLNEVSPLKGVIGLNYDSPDNAWGGALNWTLVDDKDESDVTQIAERSSFYDQATTSGFGIVDLNAYFNVTENLVLRASINNLTDKKYTLWEDLRGKRADEVYLDRFTQPGRNFNISATYTF